MSAEFFLDTNILVYTFDATNSRKQDKARTLVEDALEHRTGTISYQVVQEFLNVATRKFARPLTARQAQHYLDAVLDPLCAVYASTGLYRKAIEIQERWRYAFYDSLIIASALASGCRTLYSEDLQDGQAVESLTIVNPFG
jgi:predicted nucleic acid-binding protein